MNIHAHYQSEGLELRRCFRKSLLALILGEQVAESALAIAILMVISGQHLMNIFDGFAYV